jgi:hypothetical protein
MPVMRWLVFAVWLGAIGVAHAGVSVVGLQSDLAVTGAAPGRWCRTFVVYATEDKPLPRLSIQVTDFQTDAGRRVAPRRPIALTPLDGKAGRAPAAPCGDAAPADAPPDGAADEPHAVASFTVAVVLPEPDRYVATVIVQPTGAPPQVHELSIRVGPETQPAAAIPVEAVGPHDVEAVGDRASLALGVHNTSAAVHALAVAPPVVTRKQGAHAVPAAVGVRLASIAPADPATPVLRLGGNAVGTVQVEIFDAPPGEYDVDVQLAEPGMPPAKISGAVFLKRGIGIAIAIIAIGVLLASAISRLRDVWLDSQAQRINLGQVMERLQLEPSGDAARETLRELRRQAADISRAISDRRDVRADIENLGRRAVVFARANASAADIADLGDGRREELRRRLDEVFRNIALPSGEVAATERLSELENRDAERQELKAALDALIATISDHRLEADAELGALLGGLAIRIDHARALYQRDEISAAERELKAIRAELARAGRDAIQRACGRAPRWTSEASWQEAMAGVKALLASPEAPYDRVHAAFVDATVALTIKEVKRPEVAELAAAQDLPVKLQLMAKIHAMAITREESAEQSRRGSTLESIDGSTLESTTESIEESAQDGMFALMAGLFGLTSPRGMGPPRAAVVRHRPETFEWRNLARRSMRVEALVLGVVMAVAVVAGVKALWIDNATWGGWGDLLAAFLWGSGVQIGAEAFVGLAALRAALGRRM